MKKQEINFYDAFASPVALSSPLSWKLFWINNIFFFLVFTVIYFYSVNVVNNLNAKRNQLIKDVATLNKKFFSLKSSYPPIFFSGDVQQSIKKVQEQLLTQQKIINFLNKKIFFSEILLKIGELIVPNVWLTGITIIQGGDVVAVKGESHSMENLQSFINNLSKEKFFDDYKISLRNVENSHKSKGSKLNFELSLDKKLHD